MSYSIRWLLVVAMLTISGGASLASPPERGAAVATRADADTRRSDKISNLVAGVVVSATIDRANKIDWAERFHTLGTNSNS